MGVFQIAVEPPNIVARREAVDDTIKLRTTRNPNITN